MRSIRRDEQFRADAERIYAALRELPGVPEAILARMRRQLDRKPGEIGFCTVMLGTAIVCLLKLAIFATLTHLWVGTNWNVALFAVVCVLWWLIDLGDYYVKRAVRTAVR